MRYCSYRLLAALASREPDAERRVVWMRRARYVSVAGLLAGAVFMVMGMLMYFLYLSKQQPGPF